MGSLFEQHYRELGKPLPGGHRFPGCELSKKQDQSHAVCAVRAHARASPTFTRRARRLQAAATDSARFRRREAGRIDPDAEPLCESKAACLASIYNDDDARL